MGEQKEEGRMDIWMKGKLFGWMNGQMGGRKEEIVTGRQATSGLLCFP